MLKSSASRTVLVGLLLIAALELGLSGKFSQVWNLAFVPGAGATTIASGPQNPTATQTAQHDGRAP